MALALAVGLQAEILDRTIAIVGARPITASELRSQLALEAMFNGSTPDDSERGRQEALERLVEQRLIEEDMKLAGFQALDDREIEGAFEQLRGQQFGGVPFAAALERYGVKEEHVRRFLQKQLRFTHYVQFRFRAGMQVSDDERRAAYRRKFTEPGAPALAEVQEQIREELLNERAEQMLDERVRQLRAETRIVLLDPIEQTPETVTP